MGKEMKHFFTGDSGQALQALLFACREVIGRRAGIFLAELVQVNADTVDNYTLKCVPVL
jgi:hypothetical protein